MLLTAPALLMLLALQGASPRDTSNAHAAMAQPSAASSPGASVLDTAAIAAQRHADSVLVAILEKTNQQLSLWWNPYGVLIAALGVLFAIGAIVTGVLIFRQSTEHKEILNKAIARYEAVLDALVRDRLSVMEETIQQSLLAARAELATELNDPRRKALESKIAAMEQSLATIKSVGPVDRTLGQRLLESLGVPGSSLNRSIGLQLLQRQVTCSKCGTSFSVSPPTLLTGPEKEVPCPQCGEVKKITL